MKMKAIIEMIEKRKPKAAPEKWKQSAKCNIIYNSIRARN